jgi:hypothetical protein
MKGKRTIVSGILVDIPRDSASVGEQFCKRPGIPLNFCAVVAALNRCPRFDWIWALLIVLGLLDTLLARHLGMTFVGWGRFSAELAFPAAVAAFYRVSRRSDKLADLGYYTTVWLVFSVLGCILTYIAARVALPLRDIQFAHWDASLSLNWWRWTSFVASHERFELLLDLAYSTILPQTLGSVIYFSHIRRPDRNDDLLRTTMVAALITAAVFGLLPALGPHLKGQYVEWSATLAAIRSGSVSTFSLQHLQGIIAFPSFHTVAAILLIYSHRPPMPSFGPVLVLNLVMLLATPSEGQHYLVDTLSGGRRGRDFDRSGQIGDCPFQVVQQAFPTITLRFIALGCRLGPMLIPKRLKLRSLGRLLAQERWSCDSLPRWADP